MDDAHFDTLGLLLGQQLSLSGCVAALEPRVERLQKEGRGREAERLATLIQQGRAAMEENARIAGIIAGSSSPCALLHKNT